jgi:hypothetical protein
MPNVPDAAIDVETIRRIAREHIMLALTPAEVDALQSLLSSLFGEIRAIAPGDRGGAEPEVSVTVEDWPA